MGWDHGKNVHWNMIDSCCTGHWQKSRLLMNTELCVHCSANPRRLLVPIRQLFCSFGEDRTLRNTWQMVIGLRLWSFYHVSPGPSSFLNSYHTFNRTWQIVSWVASIAVRKSRHLSLAKRVCMMVELMAALADIVWHYLPHWECLKTLETLFLLFWPHWLGV